MFRSQSSLPVLNMVQIFHYVQNRASWRILSKSNIKVLAKSNSQILSWANQESEALLAQAFLKPLLLVIQQMGQIVGGEDWGIS